MAAFRTLLAWLAAVATVLVVLELGLRAVGLGPHVSPVAHDPVLGWANRANAEGVLEGREFEAHWRTDARGLRVTPRAGTGDARCVVVLGDSFVFGTAADEHDTLPARLQAAWDEQGVPLVALNAGVLGYDTGQAVRWFELHGAELAPRAVVLCVYENDLFWNTRDSYASKDGPRTKVRLEPGPGGERAPGAEVVRPLWQHTALWQVLAPLVVSAEVPRIDVDGVALDAELAPLVPRPPSELDRAMDDAARLALLRLAASTRALGADLLVVTLPGAPLFEPDWRAVYERRGLGRVEGWSPELPIERWQRLCDDVGLTHLDASRALAVHRDAAPTERLYWRDDWHLAPAGNEAVAEAIASFLTARIDPGTRGPRGALPRPTRSPLVARALVWAALSLLVASVMSRQPSSRGFARDLVGAGLMVAFVMTVVIGGGVLLAALPPLWSQLALAAVVVTFVTVAAYHMRDRFGTVAELIATFAGRGHVELMPTLVVLAGLGSLLIVAASSPFVAPFVYTLF